MNGFDRLREQVKDQTDTALKQTVEYLISRKDMEQKYLNEEKTIEGMCKFVREKGNQHSKNGWNYITNEVVFAWAIMYFSLPDAFLGINKINTKKKETKIKETSKTTKNNVVSLEQAKKEIENKKQVEQLTLFRRWCIMKQENIDKMMSEIDRKCKLPKHWNEFIQKETQKFHYIIKDVKEKKCYCTHCHHNFYDTKVRVSKYFICPNCKKEIYVVSKNSNYIKSFKKSVNLVQRINKNIITRVFEIETFYNEKTKQMEHDIEEYCRIIPGKGKFLSDAVYFILGYMRICHYNSKDASWRKYNGCRYFSDYHTYPFNEKKMIKGTKFEYAPIQEFTQRFWKYNFIDAVELAGYESFELLWNMKLYNLCFSASKLNKNGSFYKRFKLSKDYLKFMQDNDIDYKELRFLQLFKTKDYNLIRKVYYNNYSDIKFLYENKILDSFLKNHIYIYAGNIEALKIISEFIPLRKLNNYPKGMNNLNIYKDYLVMSKKLALNYKTKKDLFPRNLMARHDKMQTRIKVESDRNTQFSCYLRYLELSKYTYEDDKYIVFPTPSIDDLKEEGRQQKNCVASYLNRYINKETEIFFIRKLSNPVNSFITLEYKKR